MVCPRFLSYSIERNLKPKVQWLSEFGLTKKQVAKVITTSPHILGCSIESNLKPKVRWLGDFGLSSMQVANAIVTFPNILAYNVKTSLKPKVEWLMELGLTQENVLKITSAFPSVLALSINKNFEPKRLLLQENLGAEGVAETVLKHPSVLGYSYQRLSTRLKVLVARNETEKIAAAMRMTEDRFVARFVNEK